MAIDRPKQQSIHAAREDRNRGLERSIEIEEMGSEIEAGGEVAAVLLIEDEKSACLCRICHEEESRSSTAMETPCACSGTLQFAHRGCIQRWCDEKGSTLCEICLQNYEPGYKLSPKRALVDVGVTIRESLEVIREEHDQSGSDDDDDDDDDDDHSADCSSPPGRGASVCRWIVIAFSMGLLIGHFFDVLALGAHECASFFFTVFLLRAVGILLPTFAIVKTITAVERMREQFRRRRRRRELPGWEDQLQLESIQTQ